MRMLIATLALGAVLAIGFTSGAHGETRDGFSDTDMREVEVVSVELERRIVRYHEGNPLEIEAIHVPVEMYADLTGISPGMGALVEYGVRGELRVLIGFRPMSGR